MTRSTGDAGTNVATDANDAAGLGEAAKAPEAPKAADAADLADCARNVPVPVLVTRFCELFMPLALV